MNWLKHRKQCWNEFVYFAIAPRSRRNNRRFKPVAWQSQPPRPWATLVRHECRPPVWWMAAAGTLHHSLCLCFRRAPRPAHGRSTVRSLLRVLYLLYTALRTALCLLSLFTENGVDGEERPLRPLGLALFAPLGILLILCHRTLAGPRCYLTLVSQHGSMLLNTSETGRPWRPRRSEMIRNSYTQTPPAPWASCTLWKPLTALA